ncbi:MAG: hypothetical protein IKY52_05335, partial [Clostridia bacterium]|nr:hypothetical protein [Clostridia bacterium]
FNFFLSLASLSDSFDIISHLLAFVNTFLNLFCTFFVLFRKSQKAPPTDAFACTVSLKRPL